MHGCVWPAARGRAALALLIAAAGGAAGVGLAQSRAGPELQQPWEGVVEGTVGAVSLGSERWRVDLGKVAAVSAAPALPRKVRLRGERTPVEGAPFETLAPGSRVRARVRLRPPGGLRNPGRPDPALALARAGLGAVGRLADPTLFVHLPERDSALAHSGLRTLRRRLAEGLTRSGPGGALLRALALGDRSGVADEDRAAFAILGLAHLLAVSGLHLGLVAAGVFTVLRRATAQIAWLSARIDVRAGALMGAALSALGFALLAGWGVPVRRALVLLLALGVGFAARRRLPPLGPLALAAIWILTTDPMALYAPGAQLSFAATAALALGLRQADGLQRGGAWVQGLRASATALAVTAPLAALHWGGQAPLALLANTVAVPWTAFVLLPAALGAAFFVAVGQGDIAGLMVAGAERLAALSLTAAKLAAAAAPGVAAGPKPSVPWLLGAGLLGLLAIRVDATRAKVGVALGVSALLALAPPRTVLPAPPRVVALDVSQGDAVLVEGQDAAVLIDGGSALPSFDFGQQAVVPALRALAVERLDLVVASHGDLDHRGGLPAVLEAFPVREVWQPPGGLRDPDFDALRQAARARGSDVRERSAGDAPWRVGDVAVEVLWPPAGATALARNDRSLVLRVAVAGHRVLLPGDIESAGEEALLASGAALAAEVLKLPHHGSRSSSSVAFLRAVAPALAIASAPCRGRWAMPHDDVRERLRRIGAALWWTGRDGAVRVGLGPRLHAVGTGPARRCDSPERAR